MGYATGAGSTREAGMETDPRSEDMIAGADEQTDVARHADGKHVAGRPETVDDSEIEAGEREPGVEGIDALPERAES
jgi:hypothetical protein